MKKVYCAIIAFVIFGCGLGLFMFFNSSEKPYLKTYRFSITHFDGHVDTVKYYYKGDNLFLLNAGCFQHFIAPEHNPENLICGIAFFKTVSINRTPTTVAIYNNKH